VNGADFRATQGKRISGLAGESADELNEGFSHGHFLADFGRLQLVSYGRVRRMKQPATPNDWKFALAMALIPVGVWIICWVVGRVVKDDPPLNEEREWDARNG
jgi:hypothetical protein